jgi:hypothetical protein
MITNGMTQLSWILLNDKKQVLRCQFYKSLGLNGMHHFVMHGHVKAKIIRNIFSFPFLFEQLRVRADSNSKE